jgi:hypothetical protein
MSDIDVMRVELPRAERTVGLRWLRQAVRAVLLSLHESRRRQALRIMHETRHLREEGRNDEIGRPERK